MKRSIIIGLLSLWISGVAVADPVEVSSPDLRPVRVTEQRAQGHLVVYANYTTHRILVDGAEIPAYLADTGIVVTSNELHEVTVIHSSGSEKKYRVSVNPKQTLALYVDLGADKNAKSNNRPTAAKDDKKKKDTANVGYITVTAASEAQVYIDGKLVSSKTPLQKHEVSVGSHTIRVYFFDTRKFSKSRELYISKGTSMSVNFTQD